jgi:hypothetical protein
MIYNSHLKCISSVLYLTKYEKDIILSPCTCLNSVSLCSEHTVQSSYIVFPYRDTNHTNLLLLLLLQSGIIQGVPCTATISDLLRVPI